MTDRITKLRQEYEDLMKQGRILAAQDVLAYHDALLLRIRDFQRGVQFRETTNAPVPSNDEILEKLDG